MRISDWSSDVCSSDLTGRLPLAANRWTPFAYSVAFIGYDFTGATFQAQVRDRKDGGFVRADMNVTLASVTTDEGVPTSTVDLEIPDARIAEMDAATEAGADAKSWGGLPITTSGERKSAVKDQKES